MVNGFKELFNVALKNEARLKGIAAYLPSYFIQNIYPFVSPFVYATGKGVRDKHRLEYGIKNGKNSVMKHAVSDGGLVNMSLFRIVDIERRISSVSIPAIF